MTDADAATTDAPGQIDRATDRPARVQERLGRGRVVLRRQVAAGERE